jgi:CRP/FNR family transcriptional regulator, cyclic AMP receptor protein
MTPQDLFHNNPLLSDLPADHVRELLRYAVVKTYAAGAVVIRQGDVADGLYGVLSGRLTVTFATAEGRDLILGMRMPGQLFGELALIDGATRSATVVARDASSALFIARHIILPFLYRHPELVLRLAAYMSELMRRGTDHIADVSLLGIPQRLAKVLITLAGAKLAVSLSQDELSRILGVSREVVNRQLALWREGGFVKLARGRIILLDDGAMRRIAKTGQASTRRG